jgi:hypothetical protein
VCSFVLFLIARGVGQSLNHKVTSNGAEAHSWQHIDLLVFEHAYRRVI